MSIQYVVGVYDQIRYEQHNHVSWVFNKILTRIITTCMSGDTINYTVSHAVEPQIKDIRTPLYRAGQ